MSDMAAHPQFKERMDALIDEYRQLVPPKKQMVYFDDNSVGDDEASAKSEK
jgi:hypothetical protein